MTTHRYIFKRISDGRIIDVLELDRQADQEAQDFMDKLHGSGVSVTHELAGPPDPPEWT